MITRQREDFLTHIEWFQSVINEDIILCKTSALECLQRFVGYRRENEIYAYSTHKGIYDNINYSIIDNYDTIKYITIGNIRCTTFEQTINDMLSDFDNTDELALAEALSDYYYEHNNSFAELNIIAKNQKTFEKMVEYAINYYGG